MRVFFVLFIACCVGNGAALDAHPTQNISWGKAGVSLEQYALDANECSDTRNVKVSLKPDTLRVLDASSSAALLDLAIQAQPGGNFNPMSFVESITAQKSPENVARRTNTFGGRYVAAARADVKDQLQKSIDECLRKRGYVAIGLTKKQVHELSNLKQPSHERTAYLHSIDSDENIIDNQRIEIPDK